MSSSSIAFIVLACIFGSALFGFYLRLVLPDHHLKDDSLSTVKLAAGLIATMSALMLGLLVSSAKSSFDHVNNELVVTAARVVSLDRILADYGPETQELRASIKRDFSVKVEALTSGDASQIAKLDTPEAMSAIDALHAKLWKLAPHDDVQHGLRARALQITVELASTRSLLLLQQYGSVPMPLLSILVSWLAIIFAAFGLSSPRNNMTIGALLVGSICASGAIFLILELDRPLVGFIRIPGEPLHAALAHLGL